MGAIACRTQLFCTSCRSITLRQPMFPLTVRLCCYTSRETSAHKKTWSTHKCSLQKCCAHVSYTSFQIQMTSDTMLHKRNFSWKQTFSKLEGTLMATPSVYSCPVFFRRVTLKPEDYVPSPRSPLSTYLDRSTPWPTTASKSIRPSERPERVQETKPKESGMQFWIITAAAVSLIVLGLMVLYNMEPGYKSPVWNVQGSVPFDIWSQQCQCIQGILQFFGLRFLNWSVVKYLHSACSFSSESVFNSD